MAKNTPPNTERHAVSLQGTWTSSTVNFIVAAVFQSMRVSHVSVRGMHCNSVEAVACEIAALIIDEYG